MSFLIFAQNYVRLMKRLNLLFACCFVALIATNCSTPPKQKEIDLLYEFKAFSLDKYSIPATIMLPDETSSIGASTQTQVEHEEGDFKWEVQQGPNFKFRIDDWGDDEQILEAEKEKIKSIHFYDINYLKNTSDLLVYERKLNVNGSKNAPKDVGKEHITYHIFFMKKIKGIVYTFKSSDEGVPKKIIELLQASFQSIREH